MDWPGPGRPQVVVPPSSLWQPAEFTWRIQPVSRSLAVGGGRSGRVCAPNPPAPWHLYRSEPCQAHLNAVYKGCTREAQGMLTLKKVVHPSCIRCTPLVHPLYTARRAEAEPSGVAIISATEAEGYMSTWRPVGQISRIPTVPPPYPLPNTYAAGAGLGLGRLTVNSAPWSTWLETATLPPWASTTALTRLSPRPSPRWERLLSPR